MGMTHIAWARTVQGITANAKFVLVTLAGAADEAARAWPSVTKLEEWTHLSRRTIFRALQELEELGLISTLRAPGKPNAYQCHTDTSATQTPVPEGHQCHTDTQLVPHGHSTSVTVAPKRFLKAFKEKHIYQPEFVDDAPPKRKDKLPATPAADAAYKARSAAWVEPLPDASTADHALWTKTLEELKLQLASSTYYTWLNNTWVGGRSDDRLVIHTANTYAREWLTNRLTGVVERVLRSVAGETVRVEFVTAEPPKPSYQPLSELLGVAPKTRAKATKRYSVQ